MEGKAIGELLGLLFVCVFIVLPVALYAYRTEGFFDGWVWLFTGKNPAQERNKASKKVTPSQSPPEHP